MCTFKCFLLVFVSLGIVNMIFGVAIFIEGETFSSAIKKVNHITTNKLNETSTSGDQMLVNAGIGLCVSTNFPDYEFNYLCNCVDSPDNLESQ